MAPLSVKEILNKTVGYFKKHGVEKPRLDAEVLLADVLEMERIKLYVNFNRPLTTEEVDKYRELIIKRGKGHPVAYLVGKKEFMSLDFKVTPEVLIPRPETEHLVEVGLEKTADFNQDLIKVFDVGTGSGAIIISLVKLAEKEVQGMGIDISDAALKIARENASYHQVEKKIEFKQGDLLTSIKEEADLIISNPPYIPSNEFDNLQPEVKQEPKTALVGGRDGLKFYRKIVKQSRERLVPGGSLILEVGINQAQKVKTMLEKANFSQINIKPDYAGIDRVVMGTKG